MLSEIVEEGVEEGTSLEVVKLIKDKIRRNYGELLTETQTSISPARAKDGNYYLTFRVAKKDADLTLIKRTIPDGVPYEIICGCEWELREYHKPEIKKSGLVGPGAYILMKMFDQEIKKNK